MKVMPIVQPSIKNNTWSTALEESVSVPVLVLIAEGLGEEYTGQWFNPRTGEWSEATGEYHGYGTGWIWRSFTPDQEDWILTLIRK